MNLTNIQLGTATAPGSPFTANRFIDANSFKLVINGSGTRTLEIVNTSGSFNYAGNFLSTNGVGVHATGTTAVFAEGSVTGVHGATTSGVAVRGDDSAFGVGIAGTSIDGFAGTFGVNPASLDTIVEVVRINRSTSGGTAANGIGASLGFYSQVDDGSSPISNSVQSWWANVAVASRQSQFTITGVDNAITQNLFELVGTGQAILSQYGSGTFTGTATYWLAVTAAGLVIEEAAPSGGSITADNGLNMSTATNVRLGGTLLLNTGIATGAFTLSITTANAAVIPLYVTATTGIAISAQVTSGVGIQGYASTGIGVQGSSDGATYGGKFQTYNAATNNTVNPVLQLLGLNGSAPSGNGFGIKADFELMTTDFATTAIANSIISKWTTATHASRVSQLILTGVDNAVTADLFTLNGSGQVQLNKYGVGTFTGTAAKWLAVTSAGLVIEENAPSGGSITADNGLTMSTATNVQLGDSSAPGSALLHNSFIDGSTFYLKITGTSTNTNGILNVTNTSTGRGITVFVNQNNALNVSNTSGTCIEAFAGGGVAFGGSSTGSRALVVDSTYTGTSDVQTVADFQRFSSGSPILDGIGMSLDLYVQSTSTGRISNRIISKWTTANDATRTSQLIFTGINSASVTELFTLSGNGAGRLNQYGLGNFTGVAAFTLQVDASGNIIEGSAAGGADTNFAKDDLTATGDRIHTFAANTCEITFNSLAGDSGLKLTSTSTAAASSLQKVLEVSLSGANATSGQTTYGVYSHNSHTGTTAANYGVYGLVTNGISGGAGVYGEAAGDQVGVKGKSSSNYAGYYESTSGIGLRSSTVSGSLAGFFISLPSSTNTTVPQVRLLRNTSGTAAANIGGSLEFYIETTSGSANGEFSSSIASILTVATASAQTSKLVFYGANAGTTQVENFSIGGLGYIRLNSITSAAAGAITPAEGMIVFTSDTDATFTAIGFWGYENGAWAKL